LQSAAFHRRVRDGFRRLAEDEPDRWIVVDATSPADEVAATVRAAVTTRLGI
jgi:dTMP kinase